MVAKVNTIYRHQAVCLSCGWHGDETDFEEVADRDADEHDATNHGEED